MNTKHELLAPAGDMNCLMQAVANGADAVYVGLKKFGARQFANNFDNQEIVNAVKLCHLYDVKLFVTMNTLVKDDEVAEFLGQVDYLYQIGVDALIMQDFGMINLVRERYPDFEIHASTQANNTTKETVELYHSIGVKRVVLSRELSLKEIEAIKTPIEKEVFIHGALCISYSGCCLMSSMIGDRSANKGECAGVCRLPYILKKGEKVRKEKAYLLSTKELNTAPRIRELIDSDIYSFKIEGRMKSPEYVGFVTSYYRKLIDTYASTNSLEEDTNKLKTIFNRDFTTGRLFEESDSEIMNTETPNHIGLEIGEVIEVTDKKIKIKLTRPLNQQDGIRFKRDGSGFIVNYLYDENDNLVNSADSICYVDNTVGLKSKDIVCKTLDYKLNKEIDKLPPRKVQITMNFRANIGTPMHLEISDGVNTIIKESTPIEEAEKAPMPMEKIKEHLERLGDTPFISRNTIIDADPNIFISIKELNALRRETIQELQEKRMESSRTGTPQNINFVNMPISSEKGFTVEVNTKEQLEKARKLNALRIYTSNESLYNEYKMEETLYYKLPRCYTQVEGRLKRKNLVGDYFDYVDKDELIGDAGLNVTNIYTAYYLYKLGLKTVTLSQELTSEEVVSFINDFAKTFNRYPRIEVFTYGRVEDMLIKGNILDLASNDKTYRLVDPQEREFPVYFDGHQTHVMDFEKANRESLKDISDYVVYRFSFDQEDQFEMEKIIKGYIKK